MQIQPKMQRKLVLILTYKVEFPLVAADAVLQRPLVEKVGRELGQFRVHAVLNLQPERPHV